MKKRFFIFIYLCLFCSACSSLPNRYDIMGEIGSWSVDRNQLLLSQRTTYFNHRSVKEVIDRARVIETGDPAYNNIKVVVMQGTPYEMGFQNGRLNKEDIQANVYHIIGIIKSYARSKGVDEAAMDEVYDQMAPYIPIDDQEEMRGLAHGSGIPLRVIHWFHAIPELSEYAGKKQFLRGKKYEKIPPELGSLADPDLQTCSGIIAYGDATDNGSLYHLRVLDWIRQLGAQRYPVIHVYKPDNGKAYVSFSYAGFIGCFTGMSENHISFGEMGYGNRNFETLEGIPFVFLYKKLLREADSIQEALQIVKDAKRTCSYVYQFSGVSEDPAVKAVMLVSDQNRFEYIYDFQMFHDDGDDSSYPGIKNVIYAGHETNKLCSFMIKYYGEHNLVSFQELAKVAAMRGNVQDVIMKPETLEAWMVNASNTSKDEEGKACNQKWYYFNFGEIIGK